MTIAAPTSLAELTARKNPGHAIAITEPGNHTGATAGTSGHAEGQAGLRGHSIDAETYPWRIVFAYHRARDGQLVGRWEVHDTTGRPWLSFAEDSTGCHRAHSAARDLKRAYPSGRVK